MARKTRIVLEDDLTGDLLDEGCGETISFGLDGQAYEIDLADENAAEFRTAVKRYVQAARAIGTDRSRTGSGRPRRSAMSSGARASNGVPAGIRAWARENGRQVSDRGRIPAAVVAAYEAAH